MGTVANAAHREPWNKGKIVGQKAPFKFKFKDIWALASTPASSGTGSMNWALIAPSTERTRCAGPRRR